MATTVPTYTTLIDQAITDTWFRFQANSTDQILRGTPFLAALQLAGCFKDQVGGVQIPRTLGYGQKTATAVADGDTIGSEITQLDTSALFRFRYNGIGVQRNSYTDRENQGEDKIKDYAMRQVEAAIDACSQKLETQLLGVGVIDESGKEFQGFNDMIPLASLRSTGTYGGVLRPTTFAADPGQTNSFVGTVGNTWWTPKYLQWTGNRQINLISDLRTAVNITGDNIAPPNLIVMDRPNYELYEEYAEDRSQITLGVGTDLANLGFKHLVYKGIPMIWSQNATVDNVLLLNTDFIEFMRDPTMWMRMGPWVEEIGTERRQANILSAGNLISDQLRRHSRIYP